MIYFNGWFGVPAAVFQRVMGMPDIGLNVTVYRDNVLRLLTDLK